MGFTIYASTNSGDNSQISNQKHKQNLLKVSRQDEFDLAKVYIEENDL